MDPLVIRSGFDTIELAYRAPLPMAFLADLARAQAEAKAACRPAPFCFEGGTLLVEPSGGQGGYAFRAETGPLGAIWKFREATASSPWSTHVRFRSYGLASKGPTAMKASANELLSILGCKLGPLDVRISRADYAIDILLRNFELSAQSVVAHARSGKAENFERRCVGDRTTYLRVGKQPGKQLCIYSKSDEIRAHKDLIWSALLADGAINRHGLVFEDKFPADIWRFEFRTGRAFLDKLTKPRTWDQFAIAPAKHMGRVASGFRYVVPNADPNRSRWPIHPAWSAALTELSSASIDFDPVSIPASAWDQLENEYRAALDSQLHGLLVARAVAGGISTEEFARFSSDHARRLAIECGNGLADKLARRTAEFDMRFSSR